MVWFFLPLHARLKVGSEHTQTLCSHWADLALLAARGTEAQQHFIAIGFAPSTGPKQTLPNCRCVKILLLPRETGIICCLSPSETVPFFCPGGGGVP